MRRPSPLLLALVLLLSCTGSRPDPQLVAQRRALDAWRAGTEHLEQGRSEQARAAFAEALDHQPADPLLLAWRARAEAADGDVRAAILSLDTVLGQAPDFAEARYNRAAYHARAGDLERAAEDLQRALRAGARDPREVLTDPDFVRHLGTPLFAFLPSAPLEVQLQGPGGSVFVGSAASVRLQVTGLRLETLRIDTPPLSGPLRLARVEERVEDLPGGDQRLTLTWTLRVLGAGQSTLGPFEVRAGSSVATTAAETLLALAPADHQPPGPSQLTLWRPSALVGDKTPPTADAPRVWRDAGRLLVLTTPAARVRRIDSDASAGIRASLLHGREEQWRLTVWADAGDDAKVEVEQSGQVRFSGGPPD